MLSELGEYDAVVVDEEVVLVVVVVGGDVGGDDQHDEKYRVVDQEMECPWESM